MGSFGGHFLPGSFFFIFGVWQCLNVLRLFISSLRRDEASIKSRARFRARIIFPLPKMAGIPAEAYLKMVASLSGILGETITGMDNSWWVAALNTQHICMYSFFLMSSVVDVLEFYRWPLPQKMGYGSLLLAFIMEGLLFSFHLHGRSGMDQQLHILLVVTLVATCLLCLCELRDPSWPLVSLFLRGLIILQGTWFIQIGFALYSPISWLPPWHFPTEHEAIMRTTIVYSWHVAAVATVIFLMGCVMARCSRPRLLPQHCIMRNDGEDLVGLTFSSDQENN